MTRFLSWATACLAIILTTAVMPALAASPNPLCNGTLDFGNISDGLGTVNRNINSDLVALLAQRSGCEIRIIEMPAKRVLVELEEGAVDMSARFFETPERDRFLWFAHVQRTKVLAWYRADNAKAAEAGRLMALPTLMLGTTAGFSNSPIVDAMMADRQRAMPDRTMIFPDRKALFQGLIAGRVDFILMPAAVIEELNPTLNPTNAVIVPVDLAPGEPGAPGGVVFSKKRFDAETAAKWQQLVKGLCEDGSVLQIFRKYFKATAEDIACTLKTP